LRLFSFGGYGLALAAMALVVFGAYDSYPSASLVFIRSSSVHLKAVLKTHETATALQQVAVIGAKNHKRQCHKRQSVTAKREKSQTPKFVTAIQT